MNHRTSGSLTLRKVITDFTNYKAVAGLADRSVDSYRQARVYL
jgi:hypothetical protein